MWWAVAAAAAPYVMSALQDKPDRPGAPQRVALRNRDAELESIMQNARDPRNATWMAASEQVADQVNRLLGRTGMAGSSVGGQLQLGTQSKLAQAWMEDQAKREADAMKMMLAYDEAQANVANGNASAAYNYAMDQYKDETQRNANQIAGISNMINAGVGAYQNQQTQDRMDKYMEMYAPQAYYGIPSSMPSTAPVQMPAYQGPNDNYITA